MILSDIEHYLFFEKGIRGGYSGIHHRYAKANNKYLADYNPGEASSYVIYLDCNNLYAVSMSQPLPHSDFRWESVDNFNSFLQLDEEADRGYVFEVDLEYPPELFDSHSDFPLAPHHLEITHDILAPFVSGEVPSTYKARKLCQTFLKKEKYVIHCQTLRQYIGVGKGMCAIYIAISYMNEL